MASSLYPEKDRFLISTDRLSWKLNPHFSIAASLPILIKIVGVGIDLFFQDHRFRDDLITHVPHMILLLPQKPGRVGSALIADFIPAYGVDLSDYPDIQRSCAFIGVFQYVAQTCIGLIADIQCHGVFVFVIYIDDVGVFL